MIKCKVTYEGNNYITAPGFYETIAKDSELDAFGCEIRELTLAQAKSFQKNKYIDVEITDGTSTIKKRFILVEISGKIVSRSLEKYTVFLQAVEYTYKLQGDIVNGKAFTQPNDGSDRYTAAYILEFLFTYSGIYDNETTFNIPSETTVLLNFRSADFTWKDKTLFEVCNDVLDQIDSVVRLQYDYTNDTDLVLIDRLNSKGNSIVIEDSRLNEFFEKGDDYATNLNTRFENILDTSLSNVIVYPSTESLISLKTDSYYLDRATNPYIPTANKPIYDLIDVETDLITFEDAIVFRVDVEFQGSIIDPSPIFEISNFYNDLQNPIASLLRGLFEKDQHDVLPPGVGITQDSPNRGNTLFYERYKPNIKGISAIDDRGIWRSNTDVLANFLGLVLRAEPYYSDIVNAIEKWYVDSGEAPGDYVVTDFVCIGAPEDQIQNIGFRTTFSTSENFVSNTEKVNDFSLNQAKNKFSKLRNQENRRIDISKAGFSNLGLIERINIKESKYNVLHTSLSDRFDVGDFESSNNNIIHTATFIYENKYVDATYEASENFNRLSNRKQIDSAIRTTNITEEDSVERLIRDKSYLILRQQSDTVLTGGESSSFVLPRLLENFLSPDNAETIMVYTARRTGIDFNGDTKYTNTSTAFENDGRGSTTFILPVNKRIAGRTMYFTAIINSTISAGQRIVNSNKDIKGVPYAYLGPNAKYEGEFEIGYYSIAEKIDEDRLTRKPEEIPFVDETITDGFDAPAKYTEDELITRNNKEVYKDRLENLGIQYEIEAKTRNRDIIIYPELLKSNKAFSGKGLYKAVRVTPDFKFDLSIRNITQIPEDKILTVLPENVTYSAADYKIRTSNLQDVYCVYNVENNEILFANNNPTPDSTSQSFPNVNTVVLNITDDLGEF